MLDPALTLHIFGGAAGLLTMPIPLIAKKGGRWHRRAGWLFVAGMTIAGLTGLWMAGRFFLADRTGRGAFFGVLSVLLLESLWSAMAALARKRQPAPSRRLLDVAAPVASGLAALAGLGYGLSAGRPLLAVFATLALLSAVGDLRFALLPLPTPMAWWYRHMLSIMVACISAITAFAILNVSRLVGQLPPAVAWVPWVLPTAIMVPAFVSWVRRYRVRFREG
ncbi:MAG: hypothetical protein H6730_17170 [Deltaproteobacteria bacterium]|nr:hypothetical protein [Deltaproteobacteria bacterium]